MTTRTLKFALATLIVAFVGANCLAADSNTPAKQEKKIKQQEKVIKDKQQTRLDEMTKNLNLTKEQREQIKGIFADEDTKIDALLKDTTLTKEQREAKRKELNKSTTEQVEKVLTPEQKAKQKEHHKKIKEHKPAAEPNSTTK
jgi:Spy/CpxP family protein refolding chaperone